MKKLRGALIGCGYVSSWHLRTWPDIDDAEIIALCDLDIQKAQQRGLDFGITKVYTDYREMIGELELDFVDIATPPASHLELVSFAAERGLHVLCQKPLAHSLADAKQMVAACAEAGVTFMVLENYRRYPWFRHMRRLFEQKTLGTLVYARIDSRWRSTMPVLDFEGQDFFKDLPHLIVFELGVHYLDSLRYLFGEASSIYANLKRVSPHICGEDFAILVVDFKNLTCLIDMNWFSINDPGQDDSGEIMRVEGDLGTVFLKKDRSMLIKTDDDEIEWPPPEEPLHQSFVETLEHFIKCVKSGQEPETSGSDTIKTMALVIAAYKSAADNRVVMLDENLDNEVLGAGQ